MDVINPIRGIILISEFSPCIPAITEFFYAEYLPVHDIVYASLEVIFLVLQTAGWFYSVCSHGGETIFLNFPRTV